MIWGLLVPTYNNNDQISDLNKNNRIIKNFQAIYLRFNNHVSLSEFLITIIY